MSGDLNEYSIFEKFVNIVKRRRYREKQVSLTVSYFLKESVSIYYLRVRTESLGVFLLVVVIAENS